MIFRLCCLCPWHCSAISVLSGLTKTDGRVWRLWWSVGHKIQSCQKSSCLLWIWKQQFLWNFSEWLCCCNGRQSQISWCLLERKSGQCDISQAFIRFYSQFNNIMAVMGKNKLTTLHLVKTCCLPTLLFGCEIWSLSDRSLHKLNVAWNNCFRYISFEDSGEKVLSHCSSFVDHCRCLICGINAEYCFGSVWWGLIIYYCVFRATSYVTELWRLVLSIMLMCYRCLTPVLRTQYGLYLPVLFIMS